MKLGRIPEFGPLLLAWLTLATWAGPGRAAEGALSGRGYYIDADGGRDENDGRAPEAAWKSVGKVNASVFNPGDRVLFKSGQVWREELRIPSSGTAEQPILFGAYGPGEAPVLSASDVVSPTTEEGAGGALYAARLAAEPKQVFLDGKRMARVREKAKLSTNTWWWDAGSSRLFLWPPDGVELRRHVLEASQRPTGITVSGRSHVILESIEARQANYAGLSLTEGASHVKVVGCKIRQNYMDGIKGWCKPPRRQEDVALIGCTVTENGQDGIALHQWNTRWTVEKNAVHHNCLVEDFKWSAGIKVLSRSCSEVLIQGNEVYANGTDARDYRGQGIWVDSGGAQIVIRANDVHDNAMNGIELEKSSGVEVSYNKVYRHSAKPEMSMQIAGILVENWGIGHRIFNNTVWANHIGIFLNGGWPFKEDNRTLLDDFARRDRLNMVEIRVQNNIAAGNSSLQLKVTWGGDNDPWYGTGNVYSHNCLGPEGATLVEWGSEGPGFENWGRAAGRRRKLATYESWEKEYGGTTDSVKGDPCLTDPVRGDFRLRPNSPCIHVGLDLKAERDFAGNPVPRGPGVDLGALEGSPADNK